MAFVCDIVSLQRTHGVEVKAAKEQPRKLKHVSRQSVLRVSRQRRLVCFQNGQNGLHVVKPVEVGMRNACVQLPSTLGVVVQSVICHSPNNPRLVMSTHVHSLQNANMDLGRNGLAAQKPVVVVTAPATGE
jgi:hypothetical protein